MGRTRLAVLVACLVGIPAGIGAFTFVSAKGCSYVSGDARACVNCHIMNAQYDAWQKSGHRYTATCVACHLPDAGIARWVARADHGFRHSVASRYGISKEPIEITRRDRDIVHQLCAVPRRSRSRAVRRLWRACAGLHCHAAAGHGAG